LKIKDLKKTRKRRIDSIIGKIIDKKPVYIRTKSLIKARLEDDTGAITLNLWGRQKDDCELGDVVRVKNAFTKRHLGIFELHTWDDIEVIKSSDKIIDKHKLNELN